MGTYNFNAEELAEIINYALDRAEGGFDLDELQKAFNLVITQQAYPPNPQEATPSGG